METKSLTPVDNLKNVLSAASVQEQMKNAMADSAPLFVSSLIDLYASDTYLQNCQPKLVVMEALKAATLRLPINKSLGFAYIVPYNKNTKVGDRWVKEQIPQFQVGYKGLIQLAMRTGAYKYINADVIYEGELKGVDKLTGEMDLSGKRKSDNIVGYFAYIETLNGFRKSAYGSVEDVESHAKKYSQSYINDKHDKSTWSTNFDAMAIKTLLRQLLGKYGIMSVEMVTAFENDNQLNDESSFAMDVEKEANKGEIIDIDTGEITEEVEEQQAAGGPGF